jgi:uncharacterized protein (DUF58 family)
MFFASRAQLKSALAVRAAALLAWNAALGGDRVGAVIVNGGDTVCLPPRAREAGVLPILDALLALQPRGPAATRPDALAGALRTLQPMAHPGSLLLAFSDFADASATSEIAWGGLAAHAECRLFWILDALERSGLPDGRFRGGLPGRLFSLDGAKTRERWRAAWQERESRLETLTQRLRLSVQELDTAKAPALQIAA